MCHPSGGQDQSPYRTVLPSDCAIQATAMAAGMGKKTPTKTPRRAPTHTCIVQGIFSIKDMFCITGFLMDNTETRDQRCNHTQRRCPNLEPYCKALNSDNDSTARLLLQQQNVCLWQCTCGKQLVKHVYLYWRVTQHFFQLGLTHGVPL